MLDVGRLLKKLCRICWHLTGWKNYEGDCYTVNVFNLLGIFN